MKKIVVNLGLAFAVFGMLPAHADQFEKYENSIEMTCISEEGQTSLWESIDESVLSDGIPLKSIAESYTKKKSEEKYIIIMDNDGLKIEWYVDFDNKEVKMDMGGMKVQMRCY